MLSFNDDGYDSQRGPQHSTPIKRIDNVRHDSQTDSPPLHHRQAAHRPPPSHHRPRHHRPTSPQHLADSAMCQMDPDSGVCRVEHHRHASHEDVDSENNTLTLEEISVIEGSFMRTHDPGAVTPPGIQLDNLNNYDDQSLEGSYIQQAGSEGFGTQHCLPDASSPNFPQSGKFHIQSIPPSSHTDMTWAKYLSCPNNNVSNVRQSINQKLDNVPISPLQFLQDGLMWDTVATGPNLGRFTTGGDLAVEGNDSELDLQSQYEGHSELKTMNMPHFMVADLNNHKKINSAMKGHDAFSGSGKKKGQSTAAHIEQDVINKQRREIHLLMEELGTRDRELNDLVRSHQCQVKAWEKDRERLAELQQRLHQYQDELERNDQQLKETVSEMTKICEQKESDNLSLKKTKDEMQRLADKVDENSRYIQDMEVENKSLTQSVRELVKLRHEMERRDRDRETLLKDKDEQISSSQKKIEQLNDEIRNLKLSSEHTAEKLYNVNTESTTWRKKYCLVQEEMERLQGDSATKEETISRMTQQLNESLQQAIALQKALFTSCEREKCKEEVLYSMRKQQKRTMQELTSLRQLYDRQNKELTVYHLSVREQERAQEQTRQQKRSRERCKSLEKMPNVGARDKTAQRKGIHERCKSLEKVPVIDKTLEDSPKSKILQVKTDASQSSKMHSPKEEDSAFESQRFRLSVETCSNGDKTQSKKLSNCNTVPAQQLHNETGEYSDSSRLSSPDRLHGFDEDILSADSEGMCPELKRSASLKKGQYQNFRHLPPKDRKNSVLSDLPSSLEPNISSSSFLQKEVVNLGSSGDGTDTCVKPLDGTTVSASNVIVGNEEKKQFQRKDFCKRNDGLEGGDVGQGQNLPLIQNESMNKLRETKPTGTHSSTLSGNRFQAGDSPCYDPRHFFPETRNRAKVQFNLPGISENMQSPGKKCIATDKEGNIHNKDLENSDVSLEESSKTNEQNLFRNDSVKQNFSSPELAKSPNRHLYEREVNDCLKDHNAVRSQRFSENVREERGLCLTTSDGFLVKRKLTTLKDQKKSRPGSRHSPRRTEIKFNPRPTHHHNSHRQELNEEEGREKQNCVDNDDQGSSEAVNISSKPMESFMSNEENHKDIKDNDMQQNSDLGRSNRFYNKIRESDDDSDDGHTGTEGDWHGSRHSGHSEGRFTALSSHKHKEGNSFKNTNDCLGNVKCKYDSSDSESLPERSSQSTVYRRNFYSTGERARYYEKRTSEQNCNNSNSTDCENKYSVEFEEDNGTQVIDEIYSENLNSDQLDIVDLHSKPNVEVNTKPFCSTRAPSLYKKLSKIHFCEKTRRYEWTSGTTHQLEGETNLDNVSTEIACSGECSLNVYDVENLNSQTHYSDNPQKIVDDVYENKNDLDHSSCNATALVGAQSRGHFVEHNESDFVEKPSFLSPTQDKPRSSTSKAHQSEAKQFQTVVKKLNFSVTLDEDDISNISAKETHILANPDTVHNYRERLIEVNNVPNICQSYSESNLEINENPKSFNSPKKFETLEDVSIDLVRDNVSIDLVTDDLMENIVADNHNYLQATKSDMFKETSHNLNKLSTTKSFSLPEYFKDISSIKSAAENQDETGFHEDYSSVKEKALSVLEKSDIVQAQTMKMLQVTSSEYMSFDLKEEVDVSKNNNLKLQPHGFNGTSVDKSHPGTTGVSTEVLSSHLSSCTSKSLNLKSGPMTGETTLDETFNTSLLKTVPMSPATKLHKLLLESQDMVQSLEKSSRIPHLLNTKTSLPR